MPSLRLDASCGTLRALGYVHSTSWWPRCCHADETRGVPEVNDMKYTLPDEHRSRLPEWHDRWISNAFQTGPMPDGRRVHAVTHGACTIELVPDVARYASHRDERAADLGAEVRFRRQVVDSRARAGAKAAPDFSRMRHTFELANVRADEKSS